ncbi:MAG: sn-glycerol-3-phosphate ABC transporter ATP-binding protein UgpC [Alphaproteobacteria bacterium]
MSSIGLRDVRKSYGRLEVIHGINLAINSGEFVVFVGPSGCGKSTLLRMIAGLEEISAGDIYIDDERINHVPAAKRGLAMVFQSYALYPHMSVRQNMSFGLENLGYSKKETEHRIAEAARMLRLEDYLHRRPGALSGGQRQRVAIGRAVVREPKVFLFDEPLSNLDAELRVQMRSEISALHRRLGNTMIYVTHDQVEAMTLANRIAVLRDGKCEQFDTPLEIYNRPANLFVAGFIGSPRMNFIKSRFSKLQPNGITIELAGDAKLNVLIKSNAFVANQPLMFGIRPEHIRLTKPGAGDVDLHVEVSEELGGECYIYGTIPSGERVMVRAPGQAKAKHNERLGLILGDPSVRHLFNAETGDVFPLAV